MIISEPLEREGFKAHEQDAGNHGKAKRKMKPENWEDKDEDKQKRSKNLLFFFSHSKLNALSTWPLLLPIE